MKRKGIGQLREDVAFDTPQKVRESSGGQVLSWSPGHECKASFIYARGSEAVQAARLEGRSIYKVKIRSCAAAKAIQTDWRMRDLRRGDQSDSLPGERYNIREVDAISDRRWIFLVVESGVAV